MKTHNVFLIIAVMLSSSFGFSQTLDDAIKQTDNEQFETADASFKKLIAADTINGELYFYYGENFFNKGDLEAAKEVYQQGVTANAMHPLCYVGLGKVEWYSGNEKQANAMFYKAKTLAQKKDDIHLLKIAEAYINAEIKDTDKALELINKAISLNPNNSEAYILKGDVYLEKNIGDKAIQNYDKASSLNPTSVTAILRQGKLYLRAHNHNLALKLYKQASLIDSSFAPAYREKAEIYFLAGQYANASAQYKRYLDLNDDCSARERYAGFLNQAKKYKESVDQSDIAMKCNPSNAYLYRYKGYSQYETGDYENGIKTLATFFEMAEKKESVKLISQDYEYRARLYAKLHKDSTLIIAVNDFKKALELDPKKAKINGEIAKLYIKMKMYPAAIEVYKAKMESTKPNANDYFGIGRAYYFSGDYIHADSAFKQITISNPKLALGYLWRAKANVQLDTNNVLWAAKPYYEQAITTMKPTDKKLVNAYLYLGVYYMNNKDMCTAKTYFVKIKELDATNTNAKKFLESAEAKKCP